MQADYRGTVCFAFAVRKLAIALASAVTVAACGGSSSHSSATAAANSLTSAAASSSTAAASKSDGVRCRTVPVPAPKGPQHLHAPTPKLNSSKTYMVTILTNCGKFAFTLDVEGSPKTSASFYSPVKRGFFTGLTFHRVAAGFVIQGGDPNKVTSGLDVVKEIGALPTHPPGDGTPSPAVVMSKVTVTTS